MRIGGYASVVKISHALTEMLVWVEQSISEWFVRVCGRKRLQLGCVLGVWREEAKVRLRTSLQLLSYVTGKGLHTSLLSLRSLQYRIYGRARSSVYSL